MPWVLTKEVKETLVSLSRVFLEKATLKKSRAVIFTDKPEEWKTDKNPEIVTGEQLPSILPYQSLTDVQVLRKMAQYVSKTAAKERNYLPFRVEGFTFEDASCKKAHFLFTAVDEDKLANLLNLRILYLRHPPPYRTASEPALSTQGTSADDTSADDTSEDCTAGSISMCLAVLTRGGSLDSVEDASPIDESEPSADDLRAIRGRFSQELKDNLNKKFQRFRNRSAEEEHDSLIFTDNARLWSRDREPVIIVNEPLPPIPSDYTDKRFSIVRDVRDYLHDLARQHDCAPFFASCLRTGRRSCAKVHVLLSMYREPVIPHLEVVGLEKILGTPSSEAATAPLQLLRLVSDDDHRRSYSSATDPTSESDSMIKRRKTVLERQDTMDSIEDLPEFEYVPVEVSAILSRISLDVKENLDKKIKIFVQRAKEVTDVVVIFTNVEGIWSKLYSNALVVVDEPLPPFPSTYDYRKGDLVQDMVDYLALNVRHKIHKQCTVSSLQFGDVDYNKIHFVLTQSNRCAIQYLNCTRPDFERYLQPVTVTPTATMVSNVYDVLPGRLSTRFKTNVMVKERVRCCTVRGHDDPAKPVEDKPSSYEARFDEMLGTSL